MDFNFNAPQYYDFLAEDSRDSEGLTNTKNTSNDNFDSNKSGGPEDYFLNHQSTPSRSRFLTSASLSWKLPAKISEAGTSTATQESQSFCKTSDQSKQVEDSIAKPFSNSGELLVESKIDTQALSNNIHELTSPKKPPNQTSLFNFSKKINELRTGMPSKSNISTSEPIIDSPQDKITAGKYRLFHQLAAPKHSNEDNTVREAESTQSNFRKEVQIEPKPTDKSPQLGTNFVIRQSRTSFNQDIGSGFEFDEDYLISDIKLPTIPTFDDNNTHIKSSADKDDDTIITPTKNMIESILPFSAIQSRTIKDYNPEKEVSTPASPSEFGLEIEEFEKDFSLHDLKLTSNAEPNENEEGDNSDSNSNLNEDSFILKAKTLETLQRVRQSLSDLSSSNESKDCINNNTALPLPSSQPSNSDSKSMLAPVSKSSDPLDYLGFNTIKPSKLAQEPNQSIHESANNSLAVEASSQDTVNVSFTKEPSKLSVSTLQIDPSPERRSSFLSNFKPKRFSFIPDPADFGSSIPTKSPSTLDKKQFNNAEPKGLPDINQIEANESPVKPFIPTTLTCNEVTKIRSKDSENGFRYKATSVGKLTGAEGSKTFFNKDSQIEGQIGTSKESTKADINSANSHSIIPQKISQISSKINDLYSETSNTFKLTESANKDAMFTSTDSSKALNISPISSLHAYSTSTQRYPEISKISPNTRLFKSSILFSPKAKLASKLSTPVDFSETNKNNSTGDKDKAINIQNIVLDEIVKPIHDKAAQHSLYTTSYSDTENSQSNNTKNINDADLQAKDENSQNKNPDHSSTIKKSLHTFKSKTDQITAQKVTNVDTSNHEVSAQPLNDSSNLNNSISVSETSSKNLTTQTPSIGPSIKEKQDPKEFLPKKFSLSGSSTLKSFNTNLLESNISKESPRDAVRKTSSILIKDFGITKATQVKPTDFSISTKAVAPSILTSNSRSAIKAAKPSQGASTSQPKTKISIKPAQSVFKRQINDQPKTIENQKRFKLADMLFAKKLDTETSADILSNHPKNASTSLKQKPDLNTTQPGNSKPPSKSLFSTLFSSTKSSASKISTSNPLPEPKKKLNIPTRPKNLISSQLNTVSNASANAAHEKATIPPLSSSSCKVSPFTPKGPAFESLKSNFMKEDKSTLSQQTNPFERLTKGTFSSAMKSNQPPKLQQSKDQKTVAKTFTDLTHEQNSTISESIKPTTSQVLLKKPNHLESIKNTDKVEIRNNQPEALISYDATQPPQIDNNDNQPQIIDQLSVAETTKDFNIPPDQIQDQENAPSITTTLDSPELNSQTQKVTPQLSQKIENNVAEEQNALSASTVQSTQLSLPQNEAPTSSITPSKDGPSKKIRISRISAFPSNSRAVIINSKKPNPEKSAPIDMDNTGFKFGFGKRIISRTPQPIRTIASETPFKKPVTTKPSPFKVLSSKRAIKLPTPPTQSPNIFRHTSFEPTIPRSPPLSTRVRAKQVSEPISEPYKPFKAHPVNWKVLESRGDLGVPKINKRGLTIPISPKFNDKMRVHLPVAITRSSPPRRPNSTSFKPTIPKSPKFNDRLGVKRPVVLTRQPPTFKHSGSSFKPTIPKSPKFNDRLDIKRPNVLTQGSPNFRRPGSAFKPTIPKTPKFATDRLKRMRDSLNSDK